MKILFVGSEAIPFAATGGLGDVMGSLPAAVRAQSAENDVRVVIPLYASVGAEYRAQMVKEKEFFVPLAWRRLYCGVFSLKRDGVVYYFIDNEYYFKRESLYGSYDDGERYAFFSRAVVELMRQLAFYPDILHANDWQSALSVIYLRTKFKGDPAFCGIRTVYTIHNIDYQGIYDHAILGDVFDLDEEDRTIVDYDGRINLTKGVIVCCDRLTTVSPHYAEEIRDPYFASGLDYITRQYAAKTSGIVNGIDTAYYNPENPGDLAFPFSARAVITGKRKNKEHLQRMLGLPESPTTPLFAMITRLTAHKGLDLVRTVLGRMTADDCQFVLLGTGDREFESYFAYMARSHPEKIACVFRFDKALSKQIYAAADVFLMPSKSEPCGLAQMIASRYGTVPLVREVGGLYDTIRPYDPTTGKGNGITFYSYDPYDMLNAVVRAKQLYENDPEGFARLRANALHADFSWGASATRYCELYESLCKE